MGARGQGDSGTVLSAIADAARYPRPVWRSERAYVLATIAGIVGLGNIWRFPYMAGRHGGGDFVLAYMVCVVVVAIPLASLESAVGSLRRRSPVGAFRGAAGRWGVVLGWAIITMTVAILSYYLVVTGWTLGYFLDSLRGDLRLFDDFTAGLTSLWLFLAVGGLVLAVLLLGMGAIERASLFLVPVLVVIVVALAVYGQTLDGAAEARRFYLGVSADGLLDTATWRAAAGQAFYSVGVGQGVLIAYGSFVPAGTNLVRSTTKIALTNAGVSIVAGAHGLRGGVHLRHLARCRERAVLHGLPARVRRGPRRRPAGRRVLRPAVPRRLHLLPRGVHRGVVDGPGRVPTPVARRGEAHRRRGRPPRHPVGPELHRRRADPRRSAVPRPRRPGDGIGDHRGAGPARLGGPVAQPATPGARFGLRRRHRPDRSDPPRTGGGDRLGRGPPGRRRRAVHARAGPVGVGGRARETRPDEARRGGARDARPTGEPRAA
ncbi:MAG: sodium-dependent transporter [Acidimicrobiia bacterium]|nr:sodium-dependent transporter [Acidimicrobiia bacterium]